MKLFGDDPKYERWRWQVFAITWLAYAGFYLTRKSFAVAKVELIKPDVLGWDKGQLAWVDAGYLTTYAIGQFVWGAAGDRVGPRKVILTGMLASVITAVAMGASPIVTLMGILACVQGLCQSSGWAPLAKNIANFFSHRERGRVVGMWCTNYALGGFVASALAGWAAATFDWRYAFWVPGAALAVIWLLFFFLQRDRPEDVGLPPIEVYHRRQAPPPARQQTPDGKPAGDWKVVFDVLRNRMVLLLAVVYFFLKLTRYLVLFWSPVYVNQRLGTGAAASGILGSMFDLAGPVGVLMGGYLSDKVFGSRRMPMSVIALVLLAPLLLFFDRIPDSRLALGLGFFGIGFLLYIPDSLVSATAAIDFGTKRGASTAAGLINGFGSIGGIIGGTLPGWMGAIFGSGPGAWGDVFRFLAVSIFIAAVLMLPKWNALPAAEDQWQEDSRQ